MKWARCSMSPAWPDPGKGVLNGSDTRRASYYRERRPAVPHPLVECWWEQRVGADLDGYVQRVLPDACADVIVSSGGDAFVVGPAPGAQLPRLAGGERLWGLRFRTAALGAALGLPARAGRAPRPPAPPPTPWRPRVPPPRPVRPRPPGARRRAAPGGLRRGGPG